MRAAVPTDAAAGTWPPVELREPPAAEPTAAVRRFPPGGWPSHGQLVYAKEAITVLLLVLALPWLLSKLMTDPGAVLSGLGRRAAGKATS